MERKKRVAEIKRLIQEKKGLQHPSHALFRFLCSKGISKQISEEITNEFIRQQEELLSLQQILAKKIRVLKNPDLLSSKKLAFIGAPGIGKTTATLKLAKHFVSQDKKVALLTLEKEKIKSQILQCQGHILKVPVFEKWQSFQDFDVVLIDTPGINFFEEDKIDMLGEMLSHNPEVETILALSTSSKEEDLCAAIHQFSALRPSGLVFTKMDETLTSGVILNVLAKTDIPLYFVSYGSFLNGEIQVADPYKVTHKIVTDLNGEKFQYLRNMALSSHS